MRSDLQEVLREVDVDSSLGNTLTDAPLAAAPVPLDHKPESFWTTPRKIIAAIAAAALLILAFSFHCLPSLTARSETTSGINSLAVLPFANSDPSNEYLSDGITESLIDNLSRVPNLKVKSRSTVFHYKGRETDPKKIGRELGVHALLSGSVSASGRRSVGERGADRRARRQSHLGRTLRSQSFGSRCLAATDLA